MCRCSLPPTSGSRWFGTVCQTAPAKGTPSIRFAARRFWTGARGPGRASEGDGDGAGPANLAAGPRDRGTVGQAEFGDALDPGLDRDPQLHAGQVRPGAAVDAGAE